MNPSFSSYLVNDVFGDPGVYVEVRWSKRALLFDLGHNEGLGPTRLLRASDIFISHTHWTISSASMQSCEWPWGEARPSGSLALQDSSTMCRANCMATHGIWSMGIH